MPDRIPHGEPGPVLHFAGYGQCGEHDCQVRFYRVAGAVDWNMGLARRSVLLIRKDCSTCQRSWYEPMISDAGIRSAGMFVT